jgi:hypothetical protein
MFKLISVGTINRYYCLYYYRIIDAYINVSPRLSGGPRQGYPYVQGLGSMVRIFN